MKQVEVTAAELKAARTELTTERRAVSHLKTECGKHETRIEGLTQEVTKESQRAGQLFTDLKLVQEQLSKEGEKAGSKMRVLEGDKGKLQGEIKVWYEFCSLSDCIAAGVEMFQLRLYLCQYQ